MADSTIGNLQAASKVTSTDLFVFEQGGVPKNVSGNILQKWLLEMADGHGGVKSIEQTGTTGLLTDNYRITLADETTFDFSIRNGRSITSVVQSKKVGLESTYTINYNDQSSSTFTVRDGDPGKKGDKGEPGSPGPAGPTPEIGIGIVQTVDYDQKASVTMSGTQSKPVLNFRIPKGSPGANGSGTPDWAENSPSVSGYILNRTHHKKSDETQLFAFNLQVAEGKNQITSDQLTVETELDIDKTYVVELDGERYECVPQDVITAESRINGLVLGNLSLFDEALPDSGEPFALGVYGALAYFIAPDYVGQMVDLIVYEAATYKTLAEEFLGTEWQAKKTLVGRTILYMNRDVQFNNSSNLATAVVNYEDGLQEGLEYTVSWGGVEYTCICKYDSYDNGWYLGNGALVSSNNAADTEYPFCIYSYGGLTVFAYKEEASKEKIAVKVTSQRKEVYSPLPGRYLPEGTPWVERNQARTQVLWKGDIEFTEDEGVGLGGLERESPIVDISIGSTYVITFDGVDYKCTVFDSSELGAEPGYACFGNTAFMDGEDTGEPFFGIYAGQDGYYMLMMLSYVTSGTVSVSFASSTASDTLHKLPNELLDLDWVPKAKKGRAIISPTEMEFGLYEPENGLIGWYTYGTFEITGGFPLDCPLIMSINGVEYPTYCYDATSELEQDYFFGDTGLLDGSKIAVNANEPFAAIVAPRGSDITLSLAYFADIPTDPAGTETAMYTVAVYKASNVMPGWALPDDAARNTSIYGVGENSVRIRSHEDSAENSVAIGYLSRTAGTGSVAIGHHAQADTEGQVVLGRYNIRDYSQKNLFTLANGTAEKRSNAFTIDKDGTVWFAGPVYVGSTSGTNRDDGSVKLVTNGDDEITLKSPNGTKYKITISDDGELKAEAAT